MQCVTAGYSPTRRAGDNCLRRQFILYEYCLHFPQMFPVLYNHWTWDLNIHIKAWALCPLFLPSVTQIMQASLSYWTTPVLSLKTSLGVQIKPLSFQWSPEQYMWTRTVEKAFLPRLSNCYLFKNQKHEEDLTPGKRIQIINQHPIINGGCIWEVTTVWLL